MKRLKYLVGGVIAASVLVGCISSEEAGEVENVNIKSASELYGAWKYVYKGVSGYLGDNTTPYHYVLGKDISYFVEGKVGDDSLYAVFEVINVDWSLRDGKYLQLKSNAPFLSKHIYMSSDFRPAKDWGVDSVSIYTFSDVDSIVEAVNKHHEGDNTEQDDYPQVPDSLNLVIIQHNSSNDAEGERIHTVLESCYKDHADAKNLKDLCDVTIFERDDRFDVKGILSQVDTISSTEIWDDILK